MVLIIEPIVFFVKQNIYILLHACSATVRLVHSWAVMCMCGMCAHYVYVWERWGAGVETQKNVRGEVWGWGRVPFNEPYAPSLSTIYDGA